MRVSAMGALVALTLCVSPLPAMAQAVDISSWPQSRVSHPDGVSSHQDGATLSHFAVAELDDVNAGGLSAIDPADAEARMEQALSIVELGLADFEMTTLSGRPAAVG